MHIEQVIHKTRWRLIPLMLVLYVLAFLDRSNIGFAKAQYLLDTGLSEEAFALGAGIFFVCYAFLATPCNLLMSKIGARVWIGSTTCIWGILSALMAYADTEFKFLSIRLLLGAAEAGFFPAMIYLCQSWFPKNHRASVTGLFYMGAPIALALGAPLSGALLEMDGFLGQKGWYWMFLIEGLLAVLAGIYAFFHFDNSPKSTRFLNEQEKTLLLQSLDAEEMGHKKVSRFRDVFKDIKIWYFCFIYCGIQMAVYGLVFFLPTQVADLLGSNVGFYASLVIAIPWVFALFGTYFIPRYSDKIQQRRKTAALTLFLGSLGIMLSPFLETYLAIIALCFAAAGVIAVQPMFWSLPSRILSATALAGGIGFINMFGAFGGFLAPILRVKVEIYFASSSLGLVFLGGVGMATCMGLIALRRAG